MNNALKKDKDYQDNSQSGASTFSQVKRKKDCEAAPICLAVGNIRKGCLKDSYPCGTTEACMVSAIQLLARIPGVFPTGVPTHMPAPTPPETSKEETRIFSFPVDDL